MSVAGSYSAPQSPTGSLARTTSGGMHSRSASDIAAMAAAAAAAGALADGQQPEKQSTVASVLLTTRVYTRILKRFSRKSGAATVLPYEGAEPDSSAAAAVLAADSSKQAGTVAASSSNQQQHHRPSLKGTVQVLLQEQRVVRSFCNTTSSLSYVVEERSHVGTDGDTWAAETYDSALDSV
jgi:hypothetical protein